MSENQITFDLLWAIFKPNSLVYNHHTWMNQNRILLGLHNQHNWTDKGGPSHCPVCAQLIGALVLGNKQRNLIHVLVREHVAASNHFDVIRGKGRGLVGLLAGSPGCGNTLTAEAVAETTHRPLYAVSAEELGTMPEAVKERLVRVLELAQTWDAVLLLDEAEVFLQRRSVSDVKRNALVSIFLRQLEYLQEILILTTNLPEHCNPTVESRIHFSVHYPPPLDATARRSIWSNFFGRADVPATDADPDRLASYSINGREQRDQDRTNGSAQVTLQGIDVVLSVLNDWQRATRKHET
ncbi:P-loop containing nucleoside triphosphate hydrolase protein [Daedalea quercina L-15889]|uniref:p-loop containing nucleoside triphosphate hydrolase protein n=1 Tax=Daedalea quercina L-15889 TaxID=1314783 RepID=A0A165MZW1_9APHY|nr:P-loop containing nucleoside triphosphate hydrolase protein [Daedalea quercina L-15889]